MSTTVRKLKGIAVFLIGLIGAIFAQKQTPYKWEPVLLSSSKKDVARHVIQNKQGQFVVVGTTSNWLFGNNDDMFFTIIDSVGVQKVEAKPIGGRGTEGANSVVQTHDGGYVIAGHTDVSAMDNRGKQQGWVVKVNERGLNIWNTRIETVAEGELTDVVEAANGDLWLTGESGGKLWVVRVDERGKMIKTVTFSANNAKYSRGNALTWAADGRHLWIVGTQVSRFPEGQNDLLLVGFDTEGGDFTTEKTLIQAEGNGIVRDAKGNFGIIGTSHHFSKPGILFVYADATGFMSKPQTFGDEYTEDQGFGIAEDLDGNFICVGESFKNREDNKTQGWVHKLTPEGLPFDKKGAQFLGGIGDDLFKSVIVSERGVPIIVGKTYKKLAIDGWLVAIPPSVSPSNAAKIDLQMTDGHFRDDENAAILRRGKRGFYAFTVGNRDTNDVFELVAKVIQTKGKQKVGKEYENIHIGTLRRGEKRVVTIPFVENNSLIADEWDFEIQFFAKKRPLSITHNFHLSTRDILRHNLIAKHNFPTDIQAGKTYNFTFTLKNEGELVANDVQLFIEPQTGTRIKMLTKDRIKLGDIAVGETKDTTLSFEVDPNFIADVLLLPVLVKEREELRGKEVMLSSRAAKRETVDTVATIKPTRLVWKAPISGNDTVAVAKANYLIELYVESETDLNQNDHVKIFINNRPNTGEKFDNVKLMELKGAGTYKHRYLMTFDASLRIGLSNVRIDVNDGRDITQKQLVVKRVNPPNLYILSVGVDYSENKKIQPLSYTKEDAFSIDSIIDKTQKGKLFNKVNSVVLTTPTETEASHIRYELERLAKKCTETDVFMVLFSGHGCITDFKGDSIWFLGSDYDRTKRETYLKYNEDIKAVLDAAKGQKLLFLDACQKKIDKSGTSDPQQLSGAIAQLIQATPTFRALLSCTTSESSWEAPTYGHGAFTQAILEAFKNDTVSCGDTDENCNANAPATGFGKPDRILTFRELTRFVKKRVPEIVKDKNVEQNPTDRDDILTEDIPIFWFEN